MSDSIHRFAELDLLMSSLCEGTLDDAGMKRLDEMLEDDVDSLSHYVEYIDLYTILARQPALWANEDAMQQGVAGKTDSIAVSHDTSGSEDNIPLSGVDVIRPSRNASCTVFDQPLRPIVPSCYTLSQATLTYLSSGWPLAYLIATVIFGIGAVIGTFIHVSHPTQVALESSSVANDRVAAMATSQQVGQITGMVDCRWAGTDPVSREVALGASYRLASGLVEITYNTGAKVILQGPVNYKVDSRNSGVLGLGKLTACLDGGQAEAESRTKTMTPRFMVTTPNAVITDLGTEFGVEVDKQHNTVTHVFRGSVKVQRRGDDGRPKGDARVLRADETVRVDRHDGKNDLVVLHSFSPSQFVRRVPETASQGVKVLDLVDVVAGGDGFGAARDRGIDPKTGRLTADYRGLNPKRPGWGRWSDNKYQRVEEMPFVAGVFIPHSHKGPVQLDSAGNLFGDFVTGETNTTGCIWAGSFIPADSEKRTILHGIDYASSGHGLLSMHANQGITFDLEAIRRANPGYRLARFRAVAADPEIESRNGKLVSADVFVFVDGEVRFRRREINNYNNAMPLVVPLDDNDQFLTLATTDGGNVINDDWTMFGDPRLELEKTLTSEQ